MIVCERFSGLRRLAGTLVALLLLAVSAPALAQRQPQSMDGHPEFYKRVLTLPDAKLLAEPAEAGRVVNGRVPVFSIFYVFDQRSAGGETWLEVGKALDGRDTAWIRGRHTQDWDMMLVMQYAPPGQRQRVLFFKDAATLSGLVQSPKVQEEARGMLAAVDAGKHDPRVIVSAEEREEKGSVSFKVRPYVMPILAYKRDEFDDGKRTTLLNVASVQARAALEAADAGKAPDLSKQRVGIVLVLDTTNSMGPYIERARRVLRKVYAGLEEKGLLDRTSFGIVGYRNNMAGRPALEYVARIFQPLDPNAPFKEVLANLDKVAASKVGTHSWDEDAIFGLHTALTQTNWEPFHARVILQVSDAGTLEASDPKAQLRNVGILNIRDDAERKGVSIIPIHLLTPQAEREGDIPHARAQYMELSRTGDRSTTKYMPIPAGSEEAFSAQMEKTAARLVQAIETMAAGKPVQRPQVNPKAPQLDELLINELFSAQQRYIGETRGTQAPVFYSSWAADRDLTNPALEALDVRVYLTRNQLNTLAQSLSRILDTAKAAQLRPDKFFDQLRALAAATASNPDQRRFEVVADGNLLPSYLRLLPYYSRVLRLSPQTWLDMGFSGQQTFITELETKLQAYADINASNAWVDLGAGDEGLKVYPIAMDLLP